MKFALLFGVTFLALIPNSFADERKLVCYYGGWVVYRPGDGKYDIENIDPFLCTHAIYAFVGLDTSGEIRVLDPWIDLEENYGKGAFRRFNNMKKVNPSLKTLIAIGGWNEGSIKYSQTFNDPAKRRVFVQSSVNLLREHGFNGLDLDWEYPNQRGGEPHDVENFSSLIRELREEFDKHGYLLTAAVAAAEKSFSISYDVPKLGQYLDFINIMAYDFHGAWDKVTGINAPLYMSRVEEGTEDAGFNSDSSVQAWIRYGAPPSKVIMGMGLYGRSFTLASSDCNTLRCPANGPGTAGQFTREAGFLGFHEICQIEKEAGSNKMWDDEAQVPYMSFGSNWVGYDDIRSLTIKAQYVVQNNLGGGMAWSVDTDDFHGFCGQGKNPLITTLNRELGITHVPPPTTTEGPTDPTAPTEPTDPTQPTDPTDPTPTPTPTPSPTPPPEPSDVCKKEGFNRDPRDCAVFYRCWLFEGKWEYMQFECGPGLWFDDVLLICNFPSLVDCVPAKK